MRREYTAAWGFLLFLGLPLTAQGALKEFKQPNAYAVVMGISQYRADVIPKVSYAVKDAQAMAALLETQAGIPRKNIKLLTDSNVTLSDLRNHLGKWLQMRVKADSTVYIYYAGHGTPNLQAQSGSIVPWDGHPDFPDGLYPLKELEDTLSKLPTKDVVVFLDSCFSGAAGRSVLAKGTRPMGLQYPVLAAGEVMVLAAATGTQVSSDYDRAEHGLFTHYLLTGLQGEADADKDQIVTLRELVPYVKERVAQTAVDELNREQTPVLLPGEQALGTRIALPLARTVSTKGTSSPPGKTEATPSAGLSQLQQELKALEAQEQQVEALEQQAALQRQIEEKKRKIEERKKKIEVAKAPAFEAPRQTGREIEGRDGAKMLLIPAGDFMMGSTEGDADEKPVHRVSLDAFYLDKYEVTNKLFQKFARETGYETTAEKEGKAYAVDSSGSWKEVSGANWRKPEGGETVFVSNREEHPVVSVSWHDAEAYCRWAGKRLPTEAEFEYANRGGTQTTYWWGDGNPGSRRVANIGDEAAKRQFSGWTIMAGYDDGYVRTAPVGSFDPNPFGLHDSTGNVWEWTADWYGKDYYERSPSRNPTGPSSGEYRVLRGGAWNNRPQDVRSADRSGSTPTRRSDNYGFRCAKTP